MSVWSIEMSANRKGEARNHLRASYTQIFGCKLRGCKTKEFLLVYYSTFFRFPFTVSALDRDWLQHGIIMCSIGHLAFDPNTNNWWHCGLDVTRKQQAKGEWPLAGSPRLSLEMESLSAGWRLLEFPFSFCKRLTKINICMNFFL